tara:strand:+ start:3244 stop:3648 length:405 start_codon:yes stop_codon:yes gene_type:complete
MNDRNVLAVQEQWTKRCDEAAVDKPLAIGAFGPLIAVILPVLMEWLVGKLGNQSKEEVVKCAKELNWWQKTILGIRAKRAARSKRKKLGLSKEDSDEAAEFATQQLISGIDEMPEMVDDLVNEADENKEGLSLI